MPFISALRKGVRESHNNQPNTPNTPGSLAVSPSFSDFSLNTHVDAELGFSDDKHGLQNIKYSTDSALSVNQLRSLSFGERLVTGARQIPRPAAAQRSALSESVNPRQEGKIHGMSYYDYCELIRGSSL